MKWNIKKTAVAFFTAAAVFAMGSVSTFAAEPGCGRYSATVMVKQDSGKPATDRKGNIAAAITDRKKPAENMDAVFK